MTGPRAELTELVRALPDDTVPLALDLLRGFFVASVRSRPADAGDAVSAAFDEADRWLRWHQTLTWTCHVCGDERPDGQISVVSEMFTIGGAEGQVNLRYCNDRAGCASRAPIMAVETARRFRDQQ
jgi:hypothetical protein